MSETAAPQTGNIYDLGYRGYDGERLGRRYAVTSLYSYSLRAIFGLGRSAWAKVFPFGLAIIALIPATIQLGIAAISPVNLTLIKPENYFTYVQVVVALFCAVAAPEIIGRDQRNRTLPLYFSRSLSRVDYVAAKLGALITALFVILALPQVILIAGSAVAKNNVLDALGHQVDQLPAIFGGAFVVSVFMGSISLTIASMTSRRAFSTGAVLAFFVVLTTVGSVLVQTTTGQVRHYSALISPWDLLDGVVHWLFNAQPMPDTVLAKADLAGGYYLIAAIVYTAAALALLYRRFMRMSV